jgi:murein DD-endopeptidase MepM/ murein hydrolase activator NlpD
MSEALRSSGKHVRLAMAGVAAMLLGGCADSSRMGDPFADPFKSSSAQFDRTPTGTVNQPQVAANQAPGFDPGSFFSDAFKPFDAPPAPSAPPPAVRAPAPRYSAPKPIAVQSQPLSAPSFAAPANPVFSPAPPVSSASIVRSAPSAVGGWTSEGGVPVVVGQGESAESIATRYGVPTTTLLAINGYANRSQVTPGSRLTIPVYHAGGVRAAAAPAPLAAPAAPRAQLAKLEAPKAASLAMKPDPATAQAEKRARAAQAQADAAARKLAVAQAAQEKAAQAKAAKAQVAQSAQAQTAQAKADQAKAAKAQVAQATQAAQAKTLKAEADKARAVKEASAKQLAANKVVVAKTVSAKPAAEVQTLAAVKPAASAKTQQIASAAPILQAAPVQAAVKPPAPAAAPADTTASLPLPAAGAGASDSANPEFRWPARGRVIQSFGAGGNDGINIAVPEGTQVKAAEGGVVAYAGSELKGYGNLVLIRHPNGFVSAYANNGSLNVKRGETVKRGQTIALSGQTGNVASPQLHFELRKGQKPVDPSNYLAGL